MAVKSRLAVAQRHQRLTIRIFQEGKKPKNQAKTCDGDLTFVLFYDLERLKGWVVDSAREPVTCPSAFFNAILSQEIRVLVVGSRWM